MLLQNVKSPELTRLKVKALQRIIVEATNLIGYAQE